MYEKIFLKLTECEYLDLKNFLNDLYSEGILDDPSDSDFNYQLVSIREKLNKIKL